MEKGKRGPKPVDENTPLTPLQEAIAQAYVVGKPITQVFDDAGLKYSPKYRGASKRVNASASLRKPNVQRRIRELMDEMRKSSIMTGEEVMEYFTEVARGEIKDQFGLDAPLSERTAAAKEIAKRTIDIDLKKQGMDDHQININLNWERNSD